MASSPEDTIETAALGRPFRLGMLYDFRKDALIPGITLWDHDELKKNTTECKQQNSEFNIIASDSIDEKSNSLKISGSLKLSLLGGLVNVGGSAKYFQDTKKSLKQERLTLQYKTTTKFETLTISHLGRGQVSHPNVFEDDTATHVVTAILYGASAYFVFDRESSKDDEKKQVEGEVKLMLSELKNLTIEAEASFNMDEREKSAVENFSCTFHGDFQLSTNPSSFSEAVNVYRQLPTLLGKNGEHAVPVRVWLYPLVKLDSNAARLQQISNSLITYSSGIIEHLNKTDMRCSDLLKDTAATVFSAMEKKLQAFMQNCHHYKLEFVQKLGSVLPSIRGGGQEESALEDILKTHEKSPFNSKDLDQWLTNKEKESHTLKSLLTQLEKLGANMDDELDDLLSDFSIKNIVSFSFTSVDQPDRFLVKLSNFLKPAGIVGEYTDSNDLQKRNTEWFSTNTRQSIRRQLQLFEQLKKLTNSDDTIFTVTSKYDERYPGAYIFIYEDGSDEAVPFIPPSKPDTPTTSDVSYDGLTVGVSVSSDSATVEYRVEIRMKRETEWTSHPVQKNQESVTLSGLKPGTEYEINATAVGQLGYAVSSDAVTAVTAKATISPPTNVEVTEVKADSITLTWRNPSDQQCQSLLIEYRTKHETEWTSHPVQKNEESVTLSGLKLDTEYEIKVTAMSKLGCAVSSDAVTAVTKAISPPTNVEVTEVKTDSITLTWKNPSGQQCQFLLIEYRTNHETEWTSHPVQKNQESVTLSGLEPDTQYEIKATAMGKLGCAVSSDAVTAVTKAFNPPTNVEVTEVKMDSITLTWRNPPDQECQSLYIEFRTKHDTEWTSHPVQKNEESVTLSGLKLDTEYEIKATAMSKLGCAVSSDAVTAVTKAFNPPTNVKVNEVKADSITLSWRNPSDQECQSICIEFRTKHETEWTSHPVQKNEESVTLSGLKPDTEYEIKATAVGKLGYAVSSNAVTAVTKAISPPTNVEVTEVKTDSITLTWRNPSGQQCQFLLIEYRTKHETEWTSHPVLKNQESVTLSGLKLDTEYEIKATAVGKLGCAVSSDAVTAVTKAISPPTNVEVTEVKMDSITLTWSNPSDQECQSLCIEFRTKHETKWTSHPVQKNEESVTLSGLKLDTEYEIKATAVGKLGCAVSSDAVTAVTKAISPPTNVEVTEVKTDSITLTWRSPSGQQYQFLLIEYRTKHETEWTSHPVQKNQKSLTLSGLELDTEYEIKATAVSKQGCTVSSDAVTTVTKAISPPTNVKVNEIKADSITLSWRNPSDQECQSRIEFRTEHETEWTSHPVQKNEESVTLSGLKLDTKYEIRATAMGKQGKVVTSDAVTAVTAKTFVGPPIDLKVTQVKAHSITLTWSNPKECAALKQYIIEFQERNNSGWQKKETQKEVYTITLENLKLSTTYSIRMRTEADVGMSEYGNVLLTETRKGPQDTNRFTLFSGNPERGVNPSSGNPPVYLLKMKSAKAGQFNKKVFGKASSSNPTNKTIMFVGATGSGKTTLINGMINYILGVEWKDEWRFKLIDEETSKTQAHSQTSEVTAYQIHHTDDFQVPYSLTIIDTPGFGDTRGIKYDREITEKIREFFTNKNGIDAIEAVCFVVQAALARLTHTQKYIFEAILSVFGKNIANNIITVITFADGQRPPVLEAIKEANIPCAQTGGSPAHFKFNNSALFADNTGGSSDEGNFDYMFWRMGEASMKKFFTQLGTMETQSLTLTKEVLQERKQLETTVEGVQPLIRQGLSTMEVIRTTQAVLDKHKTQIQENKDFEYEVEVEKFDKIDITGEFITNCHGCNYTCHYPCAFSNDADKRRCSAMRDGNCTVCPGKCVWSVHFNMTYRFEIKREKEKRTYQELKSKFEVALGEKMSTEKIIKQLQVEYDLVQGKVAKMMETVTECLRRLKDIALRPDPLATPDYIDLLIQSEEQEAKPGFQQRITELRVVRERAVLMHKVAQNIALNEQEECAVQKMSKMAKLKAVFTNLFF